MSFLKYARIFIPALMELPVTLWPDEERDSLKSFEEKYCFSPDLQPLYTARGSNPILLKKKAIAFTK